MLKQFAPIALISLALGVIADWFFFDKALGISWPIYITLMLTGAAYLTYPHKTKISRTAGYVILLLLFFAIMTAVRANGWLQFFNVVLTIYLGLLALQLAMYPDRKLSDYNAADYFDRPLPLAGRSIKTGLRQLRQVASSFLNSRQKRAYKPIIRGIALSLPFLAIFLILFASADPVFRDYTTSLFNIRLDSELISRGLLIFLITSILIGAYTLLFTSGKEQPLANAKPSRFTESLGATESTIILTSVGVLFASFILVQLAYFFRGAEQIANTDLRYADYARRGFFELIAVATIAMALIWALKKSAKHETTQQYRRFKWLGAILIIEVLIIMLSAHMRLSLYEEAYGFTLLRLFSHLFIVWLGITLLLVLSFIVRQEQESQFAFRMFVNTIAFFALLNIINPDYLIARQNINRYEETGKIDASYLTTLSEDAASAKVMMLDHPDERLRRVAAAVLYSDRRDSPQEPSPWQSFNVARNNAHGIFVNNSQAIDRAHDDSYRLRDILYD